jgi:2-iminobutanoate/2-iminopropanoate deaminase
MKRIIKTDKAPGAIGPYSQGVSALGLVFLSGQIPLNCKTGEMIEGDVSEQTEAVLKNIAALLDEAGSRMENVVKTTVFIKNMDDFAKVNEVYARFFKENCPARSCVEVSALPKGALVEIEVIAAAD